MSMGRGDDAGVLDDRHMLYTNAERTKRLDLSVAKRDQCYKRKHCPEIIELGWSASYVVKFECIWNFAIADGHKPI